MIVGLVGYHSSGKSYLSEFVVKNYGWRHILKRELLREWSTMGGNEQAFIDWYRDLYHRMGSYEIMLHLLRLIKYSRDSKEVILLDAIHTPDEWKAVTEIEPDSILASVILPKSLRLARSTPEDMELDIKRERFWHNGNACLLSQVEWSFNGMANEELRTFEMSTLFEYLKLSGKM